jgi:HPt (histidine-containing phosphotransfer) domain-containing protein
MTTIANTGCIDAATLLESVDNDRELLAELFDLFLTDSPQQATELRAALAQKNFDALASTAHTLKGAASSLRLLAVARQALLIESAAQQGVLAAAAEAFADLERALIQVPAAFQSVLAMP